LESNPSVRRQEVTYLVADKGTLQRFQIEAITNGGTVKSGITELWVAGKPDAPSSGPTKNHILTNTTHIVVNTPTTGLTLNGGTLK
jgi:hypothetical protein